MLASIDTIYRFVSIDNLYRLNFYRFKYLITGNLDRTASPRIVILSIRIYRLHRLLFDLPYFPANKMTSECSFHVPDLPVPVSFVFDASVLPYLAEEDRKICRTEYLFLNPYFQLANFH